MQEEARQAAEEAAAAAAAEKAAEAMEADEAEDDDWETMDLDNLKVPGKEPTSVLQDAGSEVCHADLCMLHREGHGCCC